MTVLFGRAPGGAVRGRDPTALVLNHRRHVISGPSRLIPSRLIPSRLIPSRLIKNRSIQGERRQEHEEEHEGWYRNERSCGTFYRAMPLPEGTIADSAKASFKDGVLEVALQAPPREVSRGRRLEIK